MEINVIRKTGIHRAFNESLLFVLSKLIIFITLVVYVYLGNSLSPHRVNIFITKFILYYVITQLIALGISCRNTFKQYSRRHDFILSRRRGSHIGNNGSYTSNRSTYL